MFAARLLCGVCIAVLGFMPGVAAEYDGSPTIGPARGWLIVQGGGVITNEVKERFVALAGGADASFVYIPTAESNSQLSDPEKLAFGIARGYRISHVTVLHTMDRVRANSAAFVEPLRHASGVLIGGGRQWRLADAYLGTAVEREIKALLVRGGVVCGGSAGATIQGSFLVRGAPGTPSNPDGDNRIMMSPGHETGFGLLANSAIDQHVNTRGREADLDSVIATHPELLGIGIDESAAIVVRGDSFFLVGGQVVIRDGKQHDGATYYFLGPGDAFDVRTRSVETQYAHSEYPLTLSVTSASRSQTQSRVSTTGIARLEPPAKSNAGATAVSFQCNVSLYSIGGTPYPARMVGTDRITVLARDVNTNQLREYACHYRRVNSP